MTTRQHFVLFNDIFINAEAALKVFETRHAALAADLAQKLNSSVPPETVTPADALRFMRGNPVSSPRASTHYVHYVTRRLEGTAHDGVPTNPLAFDGASIRSTSWGHDIANDFDACFNPFGREAAHLILSDSRNKPALTFVTTLDPGLFSLIVSFRRLAGNAFCLFVGPEILTSPSLLQDLETARVARNSHAEKPMPCFDKALFLSNNEAVLSACVQRGINCASAGDFPASFSCQDLRMAAAPHREMADSPPWQDAGNGTTSRGSARVTRGALNFPSGVLNTIPTPPGRLYPGGYLGGMPPLEILSS